MVFYRKYRPQTISELDSEEIRESLYSIFSKEPPHAFLFTGPKGLGKTSTARIVAKVVNCEKKSKIKNQKSKIHVKSKKSGEDVVPIEPCNECEQCVSITSGTNMDIIEIDAASNRGIDEIRDLKDKIRLAPLKARKKVYIIDEVHMLTTEAFNALLKTLEEPPSHAMFVLCTTEPHKIPATILSRSFHIAFRRATADELVRSFKRIAIGEKLAIDDDALRAVAEVADGGFRDGAKVMEELALLSKGEKITKTLVEKRYKIGSVTQAVSEMIGYLAKRDTLSSLALISRLASQGIDIKFFMQALIDALHEDLLLVAGVTQEKSKKPQFSLPELRSLLLILTKAHADVKYAVLSQIPLELAVIEWGEGEGNALQINDDNIEVKVDAKQSHSVNLRTMRKAIGNIQKVRAMYGDKDNLAIKDKPSDNINTADVSLMHYSSDADTKEWVDNLWRNVIAEMKMHNHTLAGVLRGCMVKSYDRKSLTIETLYTFHLEKLSDVKTKAILEQVVKQLTGNSVQVMIELKKN